MICVPCQDPNWEHVEGLDDLPDQLVEEVAHFFVAYKRREGHEVEVCGWESADAACAVVRDAQQRFQRSSG